MSDTAPGKRVRVGIFVYGLDRPASGIGRYVVELLRALTANHPDLDLVLLQPFRGPIAGLDARLPVVRLPGCRLLPGAMTIGPLALAAAARRHRLDVVHDPIGIAPFPPHRLGRFGRVVTIHDAIPFVYPETQPWLTNALFHHYLPRTVRFADRIVTVSDASRGDLARCLSINDDRIDTIHLGVDARFHPAAPEDVASTLAALDLRQPYLLTVGALQARKNLETVFAVFARLKAAGTPHRLVVVGQKAWKTEGLFRRLEELSLGDAVVLTGYLADERLSAIYTGADCFLFPSLYEGFGLPPLEAMACGVPVVTSNVSSLPEIAGDAAIQVPPTDVAAMVAAVERILTDPISAADLRARGLARASHFGWDRTAARHASLYQAVALRRRRTEV